jgi:hypothetical protein
MPSTKSIALTIRPSSTVVPRSGCAITSPPTSTSAGTAGTSRCAVVCSVPSRGRLRSSTSASQSSRASLATSEGWNTKPPNPSQRVAPKRVTPTPGTSTTTSSSEREEHQGPGQPAQVAAGEDVSRRRTQGGRGAPRSPVAGTCRTHPPPERHRRSMPRSSSAARAASGGRHHGQCDRALPATG